jgi:hypothetical protein
MDQAKQFEESVERGAAWLNHPGAERGISGKSIIKPESNRVCGETPTAGIVYRKISDIEARPIRWLWPGRIARGKVTMIAGDPGLGKSLVTTSITAIVTTGGLWPVDRTRAERGNVIILSAEDDPADTIRPRLEASGADISRVYVLGMVAQGDRVRPVSLADDIARLAETIQQIGNVAMVVIDPVSAYLGETDSHKNADVRALLAPLSDMAAAHGVAVVCVSHLNKSTVGNALSRVTGSLAFVAAARAAYIVTRDRDDETRRLFLPAKNNIGPDSTGLAYKIESATVRDIATCRIMWDGSPVTVTADDALLQMPEDERNERDEAGEWLRDALQSGPVKAKDLLRDAKAAGISERTLKRAKKGLGVTSYKREFDGHWSWKLEGCQHEGCQPPRQTLAPFAENRINRDSWPSSNNEECQPSGTVDLGKDREVEL